MNPPQRDADPTDDPQSWGRFDTRGGRTAYFAESRKCALSEVLAYFRRNIGTIDPLLKDAEFLGLTDNQLIDLVNAEWMERNHMMPGYLAAGWRFERLIYALTLPPTGYWIDVEHGNSLATIQRELEPELASLGESTIDRSILLGRRRETTVLIASWMRDLVLDDGSYAHGVTWESKHGHGRCWAYWMRRVDDGGEVSDEALKQLDEGKVLSENDASLKAVAEQMGITIC